VVELTAVTTRLTAANSDAVLAIFGGSAVCYLVLTLTSGFLAGRLERRVAVAR
jgi:glutamate transport system permease protein